MFHLFIAWRNSKLIHLNAVWWSWAQRKRSHLPKSCMLTNSTFFNSQLLGGNVNLYGKGPSYQSGGFKLSHHFSITSAVVIVDHYGIDFFFFPMIDDAETTMFSKEGCSLSNLIKEGLEFWWRRQIRLGLQYSC